MTRSVLEARLGMRDAVWSRKRTRQAADRRWPAILAAAALVLAELTAFALVAGRRSILTPIHFQGHLSSYQPTPLDGHVPALSESTYTLRIVFLALLAVMFGFYLVLIRRAEALPLRAIVAAVVCAHLVALLGPLVVSDVYNYVDFARLPVRHHLNPYVAPPAAAPADPFFHLVAWPMQPSSYGPLFTIGTYPLALLRPSYAIWAAKLVAVVASLVCVALVYLCALRRRLPAGACAVALGLNPLLLVYAVAGAHNDFLMMALVLVAVYLVLTGDRGQSAIALVAAVGIKATAAPMLVFALIRQRRWTTTAIAVAGAAALALLTVLVFGLHAPGLTAQARTLTPFSLPDALARAVGLDAHVNCPVVYSCARPAARVASEVTLGVGLAALAWRAWRGADWLTCTGWAMVLVIATLTSVMPWYIVWVLPFAVLSRSRALHVAVGAVTVLLVIGSVPATYLLTGP